MCLLQYQFSSMAQISSSKSHEGSWRMKLKGDSRSRSQQISFGLYFVMHDKSTFRIEICVSNFMSTNMQVQGTICVGMNLYWTTSRGLQYAFIITFLVRIYFFDNSTDNKKGGRWKIQHLAMETSIGRANPRSNLHEARIWKNKVLNSTTWKWQCSHRANEIRIEVRTYLAMIRFPYQVTFQCCIKFIDQMGRTSI